MEPQIEKDLYDTTIEALLPKEIPFTIKEREFLLLGILLTKAEGDFHREYERMAVVATEAENATENFTQTYEFLRDGSMILESMLARMKKIMEEHGSTQYDFSKFGSLMEKLNPAKGGTK